MNYPWRNAIVAFLTDADDGTALGESLMTLAENYPPEVLSCVMNHLGTHDTPRILTVLGEPFCGTKDERAHRRMTPVQRKTALMRLRMAVFLQFTLPGMPCIYYGDEAGMEGLRTVLPRLLSMGPRGRGAAGLLPHDDRPARQQRGPAARRPARAGRRKRSHRFLHAPSEMRA